MQEIIEIKRKEFTVLETISDTSKKVERKGTIYFLKDFSRDEKGFNNYIKAENKLRISGIRIPKLYVYDKNKKIVVMEYIEGESVLSKLMKGPLPDSYYEEIFTINWMMRRHKIKLDFDPKNFYENNGKLVYLSSYCGVFEENASFEKEAIFIWFYSPEFVAYLSSKGLPVDKNRLNKVPGALNKEIVLKTVMYYR